MNEPMMETPGQRSGPKEETGYGRKVHSKGRYSGLPPGGPCSHCGSPAPWPEMLIGTKEISAFMRVHPKTMNRWLNEGRLPATKDSRNRWMTTRRLIEMWLVKGIKQERQQRDARRETQREARRQIQRESKKEMEKEYRCAYCKVSKDQPHAPSCPLASDVPLQGSPIGLTN